ncbi:MAG: hypothetical protein MUF42_12070 [Cytophagaceae bacterium]|jgi:hypothetical protein|nr:hypothetical protein [Cytophagaceae bacterium]
MALHPVLCEARYKNDIQEHNGRLFQQVTLSNLILDMEWLLEISFGAAFPAIASSPRVGGAASATTAGFPLYQGRESITGNSTGISQ